MGKERVLSSSIQWHITASCINRCKHCYTFGVGSKEDAKKDLSIEQLYQILDNIKEFEQKFDVRFPLFTITGGDPLFTPNGWTVIERLRSEGRQVGILGIPERVNENTLQKMKTLGVMFYQVSLDGLKDTHDLIRGNGSFERTINAIKFLDAHNIEYRIMFTVHNLNQEELIPLINYLEDLNVIGYFAFDFMIGPTTQENEFAPRMLNAGEAKKIITLYHEKSMVLIKKGSRLLLLQKNGLNRVLSMRNANQEMNPVLDMGCSIGKGLSILADGTVYPCRRLPISIGNLLTDSLEDILLNNSFMKDFRRRENWEGCKDCKHYNICRGCPAVSYAFTGKPLSKMEYCFLKEDGEFCDYECREECEMDYLVNQGTEMFLSDETSNIKDIWEKIKKYPVIKKEIVHSVLYRR